MREILQLIFDLSQVSNLIFVGGTSLYLQDLKTEISDIDVLVQDSSEITRFFEITFIEEPVFTFPGRSRAYFIRDGIMVDIFIQANSEQIILIDGYAKCCTVNSQIAFLEKTLRLNLPPEKKAQTIAEINMLKQV